jgi:hypothetical protein
MPHCMWAYLRGIFRRTRYYFLLTYPLMFVTNIFPQIWPSKQLSPLAAGNCAYTDGLPFNRSYLYNNISSQKYLNFPLTRRCVADSQWLITLLRSCKFSLERTKAKIDMFYSLRTALPEFFTRRDPMLPELQHILKLG